MDQSDLVKILVKEDSKETLLTTINNEGITPPKLYRSVVLTSLSTRISILEMVASKAGNHAKLPTISVLVRINSEEVLNLRLDTSDTTKIGDAARKIEEELVEKMPTYIVRTNTFKAMC